MTEQLISETSTHNKEPHIDQHNVDVFETKSSEDSKELLRMEKKRGEVSDSHDDLIDLKIYKRNEDICNLSTDKNLVNILPCSTEQLCTDKNPIQIESKNMTNKEENLMKSNNERKLDDDQPSVSTVLNKGDYIGPQQELNITDDQAVESLESQEIDTLEVDLDVDNQNEEEIDVVEHLDSSLLYKNPTFAEICSFFNTFTHLLGLKPISITKLDKLFSTLINGDVDPELIDLHVTLMRKIYLKSARSDKWEKALQKFSAICPGLDNELRHLQRHHYVDISISTKLSLLKALCDSQFECNVKFKENISNTFHNCELRIAPFGRDKCGLIYYLQIDCDLDLRIYTEEPEDEAGASWSLRARDEAELIELLTLLKRPDFGIKNSESQLDDDIGEMDEEQLLDSPKSIVRKISLSGSNTDAQLPDPKTKTVIELSIEKQFKLDEEQCKGIVIQKKFEVLLDRYRKTENLNKRKFEREKRKRELPLSASIVGNADCEIPTSLKTLEKDEVKKFKEENIEKVDNETNECDIQNQVETGKLSSDEKKPNDTNEIDDALMAAELDAESRRRILPCRTARNVAISNIKFFTGSPRLSSTCDSSDSAINTFKHKLAFVSTAGSNSDENNDEEDLDDVEDENDENENSSDDDFLLDSDERPTLRKVGKPPTKRKLTLKKGSQRKPSKGVKSRIAALHRASIAIATANRKKLSTFAIDESSEEEETEPFIEANERKKKLATELTLCQRCKGTSRPDLLLLCDNCDDAWHTFCLHPQLWYVPDGDWFCPPCEHSSLINRLTYVLLMLRDEKKIYDQQKKKEAAADRLRREMDYIGISLNNIIPSGIGTDGQQNNSSSEESDEKSGEYLQRKSKKHAMKMVTSRSRLQKRAIEQLYPIITVAEGRSRRAMKKVDYNFRSYDEQLKEAMFSTDSDAKLNENEQSNSEFGCGKDIQSNNKNIFDAENQQNMRRECDSNNKDDKNESVIPSRGRDAPARPPKAKIQKSRAGKKNKRLTDLDVGDVTDSDTDEWHESSADNMEEDPEPSEDEYLPSERRTRTRGIWSRHKSDDEFINDDSDPDYIDESRKRYCGKKRNRLASKAKNKRRNEISTSEDENQIQQDISDSDSLKSKHLKKYVNSSDEEEITEAGRPLRKAAAKVGARLIEQVVCDDEEEEEEMYDCNVEDQETKYEENKTDDHNNSENISKSKTVYSNQNTCVLNSKLDDKPLFDDADEFMPDEMEEVEADEEEEEAEVELENEAVDDEDDVENESSDEDSINSSGDDEEEEFTNKISKGEKIIMKNKSPLPMKSGKPSPRKNPNRKKKANRRIKKVGRGKGKKQTTKTKDNEETLTSFQQIKSQSPSKNSIAKSTISQQKFTEETNSTNSASQQSSPQHVTRQHCNPSTLVETNTTKFINSDQQKFTELPTTSSNSEKQRILHSQPRKIEIPLSIDPASSKGHITELKISDKPLSNYVSFSDNEKLNVPNKINNAGILDDSTTSKTNIIEMSIKSKLEAFVKEKSQPKLDKMTTITASGYPINSPKSIPTTDVSALNIPLSSSKMSTTIFQPVNPQQLSQYFLRPSDNTPPPASQKIDSLTKNVSSSSPAITISHPTTLAPTRIILQQRSMAPFNTNFPTFSNNTPPNVSSSQVAIMPSILPPPPMNRGLPPGCLPEFVPQSSATYFMQQGAPPQIIYQTLQPYGSVLPPHATFTSHQMQPQQINTHQTAGILDQESLSHALAGAINPEDL